MPSRTWRDAVSSSTAGGESFRPSYTPTTMQPVRCFAMFPALMLNSTSSLCDAPREHAEDFPVERVAHGLVLDARIDVRIAVDLDEIEAVLHLLDVHAVKAASDEVGGAHGKLDHLLGRLAH